MNRPKLSAPMGLGEVVALMGKEPTPTEIQKLRRLIVRREKILRTKITLQSKPGRPHQTTLAALKRTMPDLFEPETEAVREALREFTEKMEDMEEEARANRRRAEILADTVAKLQARIKQLEKSTVTDGH